MCKYNQLLDISRACHHHRIEFNSRRLRIDITMLFDSGEINDGWCVSYNTSAIKILPEYRYKTEPASITSVCNVYAPKRQGLKFP